MTLIEIILSLSLLMLLLAMSVISFAGWRRGSELEEGTARFEAMLRMARAESARTGRRFRLSFPEAQGESEAPGRFEILWEPDPLGAPNVFTPYSGGLWVRDVPVEMVRVTRCRLVGPSAYRTLDAIGSYGADDENALQSITFHQDGSCDQASIELVSTDETDTRCALIELDGLSGAIQRQILTQRELEELQESSSLSESGAGQ